MKLAIIFILVLGLSVMLGSMAAWAITYSSSQGRITVMASEFTQLAGGAVDDFGLLVKALIEESSGVITSVIQSELSSGNSRLDQTEQQMSETVDDLMAYARNSTVRSAGEIEAVVSSFGAFMGDVIHNFETVATLYASQLRLESALEAQKAFSSLMKQRILAIKRIAQAYDFGFLNMSRNPQQPLYESDCTLLATLCAASEELSVPAWLFLGTATGGHYSCKANERGRMLHSRWNGSTFIQHLMNWDWEPNATTLSTHLYWKKRCMSDTPSFELLTADCVSPESCECGFDVRCRTWYQDNLAAKGPPQVHITQPYNAYFGGFATITLSYPVRTPAGTLAAVSNSDFILNQTSTFLKELPVLNSMRVAVILNNTMLPKLGYSRDINWGTYTGPNCSDWYLTTACNPELQAMSEWLLPRRTSIDGHITYKDKDIVWDVFPSVVDTFTYFVLVGMNITQIYGIIEESERDAIVKLEELHAEQRTKLEQAEAHALVHMQTRGALNMVQIKGMRRSLQDQLEAMDLSSRAVLNASRERSAAKLQKMMEEEAKYVNKLQERQLAVLTGNIAWTVAVVVAIFTVIVLCATYGTVSVTRRLCHIIQVMEDVAEMKIETLEIPNDASVTEVKRIQKAFRVLVTRLSYYKSFMPAGLFHHSDGLCQSAPNDIVVSQEPGFHRIMPSVTSAAQRLPSEVELAREGPSAKLTKMTKRNVVAMAINLVGFKEDLFTSTEGLLEALMNEYIAVVHDIISKVRGNIDAIIGDQILVTFNAHIRCSDPTNVAVSAALEIHRSLPSKIAGLSDRVHIGISVGMCFAGTSGYGPFKAMMTCGIPMKIASILAHLDQLGTGAIVIDPGTEERVKYNYNVRPIDFLFFPKMGTYAAGLARGTPAYLVQGRKDLRDEEWLYQLGSPNAANDWGSTFEKVTTASTVTDAVLSLEQYVRCNPDDWYAMRLKGRMGRWKPHYGIAMAEGPDCLPTLLLDDN